MPGPRLFIDFDGARDTVARISIRFLASRALLLSPLPLPLLSSFSRIFKPLCIQPTEKDTIRFSKLWKDSLNNGIVPSREQVNFVIALGRKYEKVLSR